MIPLPDVKIPPSLKTIYNVTSQKIPPSLKTIYNVTSQKEIDHDANPTTTDNDTRATRAKQTAHATSSRM
jgi:hypothetical protein